MHTHNASNLSFEVVYRFAYKIVLKKRGDEFYQRFKEFEKLWLKNTVGPDVHTFVTPHLLTSNHSGQPTSVTERRAQGEKLLAKVSDAFKDHQQVMNMTTDVFMYLDRVYCQDNRQPPIYTLAMLLFRDNVLRTAVNGQSSPSFEKVLVDVILDQIAMERDGDIMDKARVQSCVFVLEGLYETGEEKEEERLYFTIFEPAFLKSSTEFYKQEAARMLRETDASSYCRQTRDRIYAERERCRSTLCEATVDKITLIVEEQLIKGRIRDLIRSDSGLRPMIEQSRLADLRLLYDLNARVDASKLELTLALQDHITTLGEAINARAHEQSKPQQAAAPSAADETPKDKVAKGKGHAERGGNQQTLAALEWVDSVIALKEKVEGMWKDAFSSDKVIEPAITRSFFGFINNHLASGVRLAPEYLSLFMDENMKKGLKDKSEGDVDAVLDKAITTLRYIDDKDKFESYYKKHLGRRLLMRKSASMDAEKQMISRLKSELGNSFTSKMEQMFKDVQVSGSLTSEYKKHSRNIDQKRAELDISVLTATVWPLDTVQTNEEAHESQQCIYADEMDRLKQSFEQFYASKHNGRKISWIPKLGSADIRATFPAVPGAKEGTALAKERKHEINVPTYALIVLLLFNDVAASESLSFDQIQARTNIPASDLIRTLQSLAVAPKTRLLAKQPMSKDIKPTDRFSFNANFISQFVRIKVGMVASGNKVETDKQREDTERKADEARKFVIEAAIVRIMKQRKTLSHANLISETIRQLSAKFSPEVAMIKLAIESLLEREYVERAEAVEPPTYNYLA